MKFADVTGVLV